MEKDLIKQVAIKLCTMDGKNPSYEYVEYDRYLNKEFTFENWMKYEGQARKAIEAVEDDFLRLYEWAIEAANKIEEWATDESTDLTQQMAGCRAILEMCPVDFHSEKR